MEHQDSQQLNQRPKKLVYIQVWTEPMKEVIEKLPPDELELVIILALHMDSTGYCFPTQSTIAKIAKVSVQTVRKRLSKLKKRTYKGEPMIQVIQARGTNRIGRQVWKHNTYQFSKPMLEAISFGRKFQSITGVTKVDTENIPNNSSTEPMLANNDKNTVVTLTVGGTSNYKQDPITNNKEQQQVADIKNKLLRWGASTETTNTILGRYVTTKIEKAMRFVENKHGVDNEVGLVIAALKNGYDLETQAEKDMKAWQVESERSHKENEALSKPHKLVDPEVIDKERRMLEEKGVLRKKLPVSKGDN